MKSIIENEFNEHAKAIKDTVKVAINDIENAAKICIECLKNGNKIFISELSGSNFNQSSERTILFTSIGISFKYTFGKLNFKSSSKGSKIKNDDVSEEASPQF